MRYFELLSCYVLLISGPDIVRAVHVHFIALAIGGGRHHMGYEIAGAAYDVAMEDARILYPRVFQNFTMTRYFVPGLMTCQEAAAEAVTSLGMLYSSRNSRSRKTGEADFTVIVSPACGFEGIVLGDFAREEDVNVFLSTSSLTLHNDKRRFPTTFPWFSNGFDNIIWSMFELVKLYNWTKFTLVCDDNKKDPISFILDIFCLTAQQSFRLKALRSGDINMLVVKFDSSRNESIRPMLAKCMKYSTIIALATSPAAYKAIMDVAAKIKLSTGDYVFILLPLTVFVQFEELLWSTDQVSGQIREMLPYCLVVSFVDVNWTAMEETVEQVVKRSISAYNWTILPQFRHNLLSLSAYETTMIVAQVLNESYDRLEHLSGKDFAKRFWSRSFQLPSRIRQTTQVGYPVAHIWIKQFHPETSGFLPVLKYDALSGQLGKCTDCHNVTWPRGTFPPPVMPLCGYEHELCQDQDRGRSILTGVLVTLTVVVLLGAICCIRYFMRGSEATTATWWLLDGTLKNTGRSRKKPTSLLSNREYALLAQSFRSFLN